MTNKNQLVVIKDKEEYEVMLILVVKNYDNSDHFQAAVDKGRCNYEDQEEYEIAIDDCILEAIENHGYVYEFATYETVSA